MRFNAEAGKIYVLQTSTLGAAADTYLQLYDPDGQTELAHNDDYGYLLASRIVWQAPTSGEYFARIRHHNTATSGVDTQFNLFIQEGVCIPDASEGDNGSLAAPLIVPDGQPVAHNFCADPLLIDVNDQDWVRFTAVGGADYDIRTSALGPLSDTVLRVYNSDRETLLAVNDDYGSGKASAINFTAPASNTYYVQVIQYNSNYFGDQATYELAISGEIPPSPTPTPTPTPTATPTLIPTQSPSEIKTLILTNYARLENYYGAGEANSLLSKLYELADESDIAGAVTLVENDTAVAAAYAAWTADQNTLLNTENANAVASAVRNLALTFYSSMPNLEYVVIVGDDRIIPFRRIPEGNLTLIESQYASSVTISTTQRIALQENMILSDDYYVDREPTAWSGQEVYLPDYGLGRLVELPSEIRAFIDEFLTDPVLETNQVLVTAYDFVRDLGTMINTIFESDGLTTDDALVGYSWNGDDLRTKLLAASPRFDLSSLNGHSTHLAAGVPDEDNITAAEVAAATSDLAGALVFSVGCHAGLNDPGVLDLTQAYAQLQANYVGNTGYGWGGGGIVYSEALMRNFTRELVRNETNQIGPAFSAAKQKYYQYGSNFNAYDAKVLMQSTLYGLPMYQVTSGPTLGDDDPFPSANITTTTPANLGEVKIGQVDLGLGGAFGDNTTSEGTFLTLDNSLYFASGEPIQPYFYANVAAPAVGALHGVIFLGGTYSDTQAFDPVIALAANEYVPAITEPAFDQTGWYPGTPFQVKPNQSLSFSTEMLVTQLGQFNSASGTERVYEQMSFGTLFSTSTDTEAPTLTALDGILDPDGTAQLKVEANDPSGILRVVAAYTNGQGEWQSLDLAYIEVMKKWTGEFSATTTTRYFVQIIDGAGNVNIKDNKGLYYPLLAPLPLIQEAENTIYLPLVLKGG